MTLPVRSVCPNSFPEESVTVAPATTAPWPSWTVIGISAAPVGAACPLPWSGAHVSIASTPAVAMNRNHCIGFASRACTQVEQQLSHSFSTAGNNCLGRDFTQRYQDESALGQAGMGISRLGSLVFRSPKRRMSKSRVLGPLRISAARLRPNSCSMPSSPRRTPPASRSVSSATTAFTKRGCAAKPHRLCAIEGTTGPPRGPANPGVPPPPPTYRLPAQPCCPDSRPCQCRPSA